MKIAILAWGSLLWCKRDLEIVGTFEPNGPKLPVEFCRVSGDGRLTLVIDETHGKQCTTYSAQSSFEDLDDALANLWTRESHEGATMPINLRNHSTVAFVDLVSRDASPRARRHINVVESISKWATANSLDAVIWTSLGIKFKDATGVSFSVSAAVNYLASLNSDKRAKAFEYIRNAPPTIQTPLRVSFDLRWPRN